jgi:hypothetical protein
MRRMKKSVVGVLALALGLSSTACLDLDVANENNPDRRRALSSPADVEFIVGVSTWRRWYAPIHSLANIANPFPTIAGEMGTSSTTMNVHWGQDPPAAYHNDELVAQVWMPRHGYDQWSQCVSTANDALLQINEGMRIRTDDGTGEITDNTDRAVAWGKLWQGICIGYLANFLDRFPIATEQDTLPVRWQDLAEWERVQLQEENWRQRLPLSIGAIEDAIELMEASEPWFTPAVWVPGRSYSTQEIIQLAHTMIARILIYSARTPADRAALDWNKILFHTERGLSTYDWGPVLESGVVTDPSYLARLSNTGTGSFRAHYLLIGPADQSGGYQEWIAVEPRDEADRFIIETPDRRILGATPVPVSATTGNPTSTTANPITNEHHGAYFRYVTAAGGYSTLVGLQHRSWYGWWRRINEQNLVSPPAHSEQGHFQKATVDENRLYMAEALLRLNRVEEAVDLINVTRTRGHTVGTIVYESNLPPLEADGTVPEVDGACVPRRTNGDCGDVWDALMYERDIELVGIEPTRSWMDRRGFGQLRDGVWTQLPVPARYLTSLGVASYTFGGVGGESSAVCTAPITCRMD